MTGRVRRPWGLQATRVYWGTPGAMSAAEETLATLFEEADAARTAGDPARALDRLRRAVALQPRAAVGQVLLALALIEAGALEEAAEAADAACRLAPDSGAAHIARARARRLMGDAAGALDDLDAALALKPIDADGHYERAQALAALDRRAEAVEALKAGLVCAPRHAALKALARRLSAGA